MKDMRGIRSMSAGSGSQQRHKPVISLARNVAAPAPLAPITTARRASPWTMSNSNAGLATTRKAAPARITAEMATYIDSTVTSSFCAWVLCSPMQAVCPYGVSAIGTSTRRSGQWQRVLARTLLLRTRLVSTVVEKCGGGRRLQRRDMSGLRIAGSGGAPGFTEAGSNGPYGSGANASRRLCSAMPRMNSRSGKSPSRSRRGPASCHGGRRGDTASPVAPPGARQAERVPVAAGGHRVA